MPPENVGTTITVRLDSRTVYRLGSLIEHFEEQENPFTRGITVSKVVRAAIDEMYAKHLGSPS